MKFRNHIFIEFCKKYSIPKRETQSNITPLLWSGVILWSVSLIISSILAIFGYGYFEQDTLYEFLNVLGSISPLLLFMYVCIIGPIIEEYAFRYWTVGKLSARITSLILATILVFLVSGNIFLAISVAALLSVLMFVVKKNEIVLIISTSSIFALLHINGFSQLSISAIFGLLQLFGGAIVLCCLALKYRFEIAIAIHIINNIIAIAPNNETSKSKINFTCITSEGENRMACKPMTGKHGDLITLSNSTETIISFQGSISEFIDMMYDIDTNHTMTTLYRINEETEKSMSEYSFVLKLCDSNAIDYNNILCRTMERTVMLKQDTLYEPAYYINIKDNEIFSSRQTSCEFPITLSDLAKKMQFNFDKPIIITEGIDKDQTVCLNSYHIYILYEMKDINLFNEVFNKSIGIELIESDTKVPVIEFIENNYHNDGNNN